MPVPGIDWFTPHGEGWGRAHVRLPFQTEDGALILVEYRGIFHATEAFDLAVKHNSAKSWDEQSMRMARMFDTTSARYPWLTQSLFLARGRLLGDRERTGVLELV